MRSFQPSLVAVFLASLVLRPISLARAQQPALPNAPLEVAASPVRIVLTVPDAEHYAINSQPIHRRELQMQLRMIYEQRPTKVLLVALTPVQHSLDLGELIRVARELGITLYLAAPGDGVKRSDAGSHF